MWNISSFVSVPGTRTETETGTQSGTQTNFSFILI
jgi:hypothetical protein